MNKLTRCFIALEMPREAINAIENIQTLIKKQKLFYGKFTEGENLHLTLKFLGEISEEKLEETKRRLNKIKFLGFEVKLGEIGFFSEKFFRIIWVKLMGKGVYDLQKEIDNSLGNENLFIKESRFMGHITIARIKKVLDKKAFLTYIKNMKVKETKFKVTEFVLKKSELKPEGPVYTDLVRYKLSN